jgi:hypothetical protein
MVTLCCLACLRQAKSRVLTRGLLRPVTPRRTGNLQSLADLRQAVSSNAVLRGEPAGRRFPDLTISSPHASRRPDVSGHHLPTSFLVMSPNRLPATAAKSPPTLDDRALGIHPDPERQVQRQSFFRNLQFRRMRLRAADRSRQSQIGHRYVESDGQGLSANVHVRSAASVRARARLSASRRSSSLAIRAFQTGSRLQCGEWSRRR